MARLTQAAWMEVLEITGPCFPIVAVKGVPVIGETYGKACGRKGLSVRTIEVDTLTAARLLLLHHPIDALRMLRADLRWEHLSTPEALRLLGARDRKLILETSPDLRVERARALQRSMEARWRREGEPA